jgi:hypothetical protein
MQSAREKTNHPDGRSGRFSLRWSLGFASGLRFLAAATGPRRLWLIVFGLVGRTTAAKHPEFVLPILAFKLVQELEAQVLN